MDEIIKDLSQKLNIAPFELKKMICQIFSKDSYQEELLELLGYENIECISSICSHKDYFIEKEDEVEAKKYFMEFCLPVYKSVDIDEKTLISVDNTGTDSKYFEYTKFNPVQSAVFTCAYKTDSNFLVCAPTGSGKTDVALLAILRALKKPNSKIVYIVPMKALASEISHKYKNKLANHTVVEFTGDTDIKNKELFKSDLIICTPEKFDAYTRKLNNIFQDCVSLVIIDEIHILHDDRGSILEAIVSRLFRYTEIKQKHIRIVGLSATLPNFKDVGDFLKTDKVFNFDQSYRPVPLKTSILGIFQNTTRKQSDSIFIERIEKFRQNKKQVLVFVTARHETLQTAKLLINPNYVNNLDKKIKLNDTLEHILGHRIGVHHAGLPRNIRLYMENKFKNGQIDILVCTSTLAWGVNLPAHAVVIKNTTFYDPNLGLFRDLGILDIYQIFGRAGRPQYKITGEAVLITEYNKVSDYMRMIKNNTVIESRLLRHVANLINSEIYLNNINNISDGLNWFRNTFMYVRLIKNPSLYGLSDKDFNNEESVLSEYIYLTVKRLEECKLISVQKSDSNNYIRWRFLSTEFGRISSFYYLEHDTILYWLKNVDFLSDEEGILNLLLENKDFNNIQLRQDEEYKLSEICSMLDIYLDINRESKLYILIVAYLRKFYASQFSLKCDQLFISKNLERIFSAFIEFLEFLKKYNLLVISLNIYSRIINIKQSSSVQNSKNNFNIDLEDCGSYIKIFVNSDELRKFYIIIYNEETPAYISHGYRTFSTFIKKEISFTDKLRILIYDVSKNLFKEEIYKIKRPQVTSSLIKENINIEFYISYISDYQEFIKKFVTDSLQYLETSVMIICRSKSDYKLLNREISTRIAIYNYETGRNISKKISHNISSISDNCIYIVTLERALTFKKDIFTIFLSCQRQNSIFYSNQDILKVCEKKKVLIYENEEFIEYFRSLL